MELRKSRYTFLLKDKGTFLVYNSSSNNFWKINENVYNLLNENESFDIGKMTFEEAEKDLISHLHQFRLLTTFEEDESISEEFRLKYLAQSFSKESLNLTIAPTISCNLCCPYCFEESKPTARMDDEVCRQLVDFIKKHSLAKELRVTWFGGEPLLCIDVIMHLIREFRKLDTPQLKYQEIITNATLLIGDNLNLFENNNINAIQVTFDGVKEHHDKKRVSPSGIGTFESIMENVDSFIDKFPDITIKLRVNIDKTNADDFVTINDYFCKKYPHKRNLFVYPAALKACSLVSKDSPFLCNAELADLYSKYMAKGLMVSYPRFSYYGCGANMLSNYVVGPQGELYKCWQDLGIPSKIIGNITLDNFSNELLIHKYMLHGSHMWNNDCLECPLMPICDSNCANDRIENTFNKGNYDLCSVYKENDYKFLKEKLINFYHYITTQRQRAL